MTKRPRQVNDDSSSIISQLPFMAVGSSIFWMLVLAPATFQRLSSHHWPVTQGRIVGSWAARTINQSSRHVEHGFTGRVRVEYEAAGQTYVTNKIRLGNEIFRRKKDQARNDISKYHLGQSIPVYFCPLKPSVGILQPGIPDRERNILVTIFAAFMIGLIAMIGQWTVNCLHPTDPNTQVERKRIRLQPQPHHA